MTVRGVTPAARRDAGVDPAAAVTDFCANDIGVIELDDNHARMSLYGHDCVVAGHVPRGDGCAERKGGSLASRAGRIIS